MTLAFQPIGVVRTKATNVPRHWSVSDVEGTLVIDEQYAPGLWDIEAGQRIVVIFTFDRAVRFSPADLIQISGESGKETGVFSTCSPIRPNPLGMSLLEVVAVDGARIEVRGVDMLDGTPILDIKPHIPVPG